MVIASGREAIQLVVKDKMLWKHSIQIVIIIWIASLPLAMTERTLSPTTINKPHNRLNRPCAAEQWRVGFI